MRFRKKPVVIEAVQWDGVAFNEPAPSWLADAFEAEPTQPGAARQWNNHIRIFTLEGVLEASPNDWIIRGVKGELYPCKPEIFAATYEPAE